MRAAADETPLHARGKCGNSVVITREPTTHRRPPAGPAASRRTASHLYAKQMLLCSFTTLIFAFHFILFFTYFFILPIFFIFFIIAITPLMSLSIDFTFHFPMFFAVSPPPSPNFACAAASYAVFLPPQPAFSFC